MQDKELESVLTEQIEKFGTAVEGIAEFSKEQIPEVIEQLLMWNFISSVVWALITGMVFVGGAIYIRGAIKKIGVKNLLTSDAPPLMVLLVGLFLFIVANVSINQMFKAAQIQIAPKVWVLEYANDLRK